jgi:hypothetical protein
MAIIPRRTQILLFPTFQLVVQCRYRRFTTQQFAPIGFRRPSHHRFMQRRKPSLPLFLTKPSIGHR